VRTEACFRKALYGTKYEVQGLGIEMNQRYIDQLAAVYVDDEDMMSPPGVRQRPCPLLLTKYISWVSCAACVTEYYRPRKTHIYYRPYWS
jgi:hypothetical protein